MLAAMTALTVPVPAPHRLSGQDHQAALLGVIEALVEPFAGVGEFYRPAAFSAIRSAQCQRTMISAQRSPTHRKLSGTADKEKQISIDQRQ